MGMMRRKVRDIVRRDDFTPRNTIPDAKFRPQILANFTWQLAKITSVNATVSAVEWTYGLTFQDNSTASGHNALEPLNGSPGSLGVTVATTGTLTGTSCIIKPLGTSPHYIPVYQVAGAWYFALPNSAGA